VAFFDPGLSGTRDLSNVDITTFAWDAINTGVLKPKSALTSKRKLATFLNGRHTVLMLCLISTLLMRLKFDPTKCKKATDIRFSLGIFCRARWVEGTIYLSL